MSCMASEPTIGALGGGGFSMEPENLALVRYILAQAGTGGDFDPPPQEARLLRGFERGFSGPVVFGFVPTPVLPVEVRTGLSRQIDVCFVVNVADESLDD